MSNAQNVKNYIRESEIKNNNTRNLSLRRAYNKVYGGMKRSEDEEKKTSGWFDWVYPSYWFGDGKDEAATKIQNRIRVMQARKRLMEAKRQARVARIYADADRRRSETNPYAAIARRKSQRRAARAALEISKGSGVSEKKIKYKKSASSKKRPKKKKPTRSKVAALAARFEK